MKTTANTESELAGDLAVALADNNFPSDISVKMQLSPLPDSPSVFYVGRGRRKAVLLLSPKGFPDVVFVDQTKAAQMKALLGPELGSVILTPLAQGRIIDRSYVVLPLARSFSESRLWWVVKRRSVLDHLTSWLRRVTEKHCSGARLHDIDKFEGYLRELSETSGLDESLRSISKMSVGRLHSGKFNPRVVPMHNDVWKGNVLLPRNRNVDGAKKYPFYLIDWRGSRLDGFPFFDLIRMSLSFSLTPSALKKELIYSCETLGCNYSDIEIYLAAALGEIASRKDQFSTEALRNMTVSCFMELRKAAAQRDL